MDGDMDDSDVLPAADLFIISSCFVCCIFSNALGCLWYYSGERQAISMVQYLPNVCPTYFSQEGTRMYVRISRVIDYFKIDT
jgi:hypothetical protein